MIKIFNLLSVSALWIAFCGIFWIALCKLSGQPFDYFKALILFLITFAIYLGDHASGSKEDLLNNPDRAILAKYPAKHIAILAYVIAIIIVVVTDLSKLPYAIVPGIAGAVYTMRIGSIRPKDLPGMKTLIVTTSTAICRGGLVGGAEWLYVLVFLVMIIDTVLCDLRDIEGDRISDVRTIPVMLDRSRTLAILAVIDIGLFALCPIVAAIGLGLIWYFRKERNNLSYDLWVDGWMLWAWIFLIFFSSSLSGAFAGST